MDRKSLTPRQQFAMLYREIRWVQKNVKLARWKPSEYRKRFMNRTIEQIIESQETNYMNPCMDLTLTLIHRLRQIGFRPQMVVQEIIGPHTKQPAFHFGIEVMVGDALHTVDFKTGKAALVYEGEFTGKKSNPHAEELHIHRPNMREFELRITPGIFIGMPDFRSAPKVFKHVRGKHLEAILKAMKKADSTALHEEVNRRRKLITRPKTRYTRR